MPDDTRPWMSPVPGTVTHEQWRLVQHALAAGDAGRATLGPELRALLQLLENDPRFRDPQPPGTYVPYTLPESRKAVLLSGYIHASADQHPLFADLLASRGYQVTRGQLTLAALRKMPGQDIGVLCLTTHATSEHPFGIDTQEHPRVPAEETPENQTLLGEDSHATDRDGNPFIRATAQNEIKMDDRGIVRLGDEVSGYSARIGFFRKHWKDASGQPLKIFAKYSVVAISACYLDPAGEFVTLLKECGAGTVLVWDDDVAYDVARQTTCYILDRLLGTNRPEPQFHPEAVLQRPFQWGMVLQDMHNHSTGTCTLGGPYLSALTGNVANLRVVSRDDCPGPFLLPSIQGLTVDEGKGQLLIHGFFGPDLGSARRSVHMYATEARSGGRLLEVTKWDEHAITCTLPPADLWSAAPAPGTCGYVAVVVDERPSNAIALTLFRGEIVATQTADGSLTERFAMRFGIRADAHPVRMLFSEPLSDASYAPRFVYAHATSNSTLRYEARGSAEYGSPPSRVVSYRGVSDVRPRSADPTEAKKRPASFFDLLLLIQGTASLEDVHDMSLDVQDAFDALQTALHEEVKDLGTGSVVATDHGPYLTFGSFGGPLADVAQTSSFEFPDRTVDEATGTSGRRTLTVSIKTHFPPPRSGAEEHLPPGW